MESINPPKKMGNKGRPKKEETLKFVQPFCPNPDCKTHSDAQCRWFNHSGTRQNKSGIVVFCFNCKNCGKYFSSRTFDIDYWTHIHVDYLRIQNQLVNGSGIRQTCRNLGLSWSVLSNGHHRLKRQALGLHAKAIDGNWRFFVHSQTNSRVARSKSNPLFAVNYMDRQIRKDLAEPVRETTRFAKRIEFSVDKMIIY